MTIQLTIPDMACSACRDTITKAVQAIDPAAIVQADLTTKQVNIETDSAASEVKRVIASAGYTIAESV